MPEEQGLDELRDRVDAVNRRILALLQERAELVLRITPVKCGLGLDGYDPGREDDMLRELAAEAEGPFGPAEIRSVFRAIFDASLAIQDRKRSESLHFRRRDLVPEGGVRVGDQAIGAGRPVVIAGPCSVESPEQVARVAEAVARLPGPKLLRAGAFKPRTSPYAFQGLREDGLRVLSEVARRHGLATVTEVLDAASVDVVAEHADMLQVGARNMYNTELLKALGRIRKPVLLKRGFMATVEELLLAAEYVLAGGNESVVLCERGIRTFERATRNTLDLAAVALLKLETSLPVVVDLSHSLGRRDIVVPCARAALAVGADGIMVEVHPEPDRALSDGFQQLDLEGFAELVGALGLSAASAGTRSAP